LRVARDGSIRQEYAKRSGIIIRSGEAHKPVVFSLEQAPTMAGRIQTENGEPISNILVEALKAEYGSDGKRTFTALASTLSDDRGDYRLYWMDPGEYVVSASYVPVIKTSVNPIETRPRIVYAPTYYPNASALTIARHIVLKADQNNLTLDFRLIRAPVVTVRGSLTESNHPVSTIVTLQLAGDATRATRYSTKSDALGSFEFKNVAPGSYIATAEIPLEKELFKASKHIIVYDRDENNVGLILSPGFPVSGRIVFDTGAALSLGGAHSVLNSVDPYLDSFTSPAIPSNGEFSINSVQPGEYTFDVAGIPEDLYIKSERSAQTNLQGLTLGLGTGSPAPFEILLGTDGGRVIGTVVDAERKPFAGAQVVLVPKGDRRSIASNYRVAGSDEDGNFDLRGIPPGDYQLFAWEDVEDRAWLNSEFVGNYQDVGTAVTIVPNARGTIQLPLIPEKR
jgi:hypothetical protein